MREAACLSGGMSFLCFRSERARPGGPACWKQPGTLASTGRFHMTNAALATAVTLVVSQEEGEHVQAQERLLLVTSPPFLHSADGGRVCRLHKCP